MDGIIFPEKEEIEVLSAYNSGEKPCPSIPKMSTNKKRQISKEKQERIMLKMSN